MMDMARAHVFIAGRVQGVNFRASARNTLVKSVSPGGCATWRTGASRRSLKVNVRQCRRWSAGATAVRRMRVLKQWTCAGRSQPAKNAVFRSSGE